MKSQKKATAQHRLEWARAVTDGRVLRFGIDPATHFKSYPTTDERDTAYAEATKAGMPVKLVGN